MAKNNLSDLGSQVCVNDENEHIVPALGNGAAIPGDLCGINPDTGQIILTQGETYEGFVGILKESKITGTETAIVAGVPCSLVVPKSGHRYRVRTIDLNKDWNVGFEMIPSGTAGKMEGGGHFPTIAKLSLKYIDDDTVAEVTWA